MIEPRVQLLPGDSGRTFVSSGLVVLRESRAFFERVVSNPPTTETRDYEAMLAWQHEVIHFIHAFSTAFLFSYSTNMVRYAFNILENFEQFLAMKEKETLLERGFHLLSNRKFGISVRDILEGVAVVESFKLNDPNPTAERFIVFLSRFFGEDSDSCYRVTFDYLSNKVGVSVAFDLIAPISFIALQSDFPPKSFKILIERLLPNIPLEKLKQANASQLFSYFGMDVNSVLLLNLESVPGNFRHPIYYECAKHSISLLSPSTLLEIAARPSIIRSLNFLSDEVDSLVPPLVAFSSAQGFKLAGGVFGLAKRDSELAALILHTASLVGAAERLTVYKNIDTLYQFCPHRISCPHFDSALCFNHFAPPSIELGHTQCSFVRFFESKTKMKPDVAWSTFQKG